MKKDRKYRPRVMFAAEKLFFHPDSLLAMLSDDKTAPPIEIEFSPTSRCNLKCYYCTDNEWRNRCTGDIDSKVALNAFEQFKELGAKSVCIEGGGEPTLHPNFVSISEGIRKIGLDQGLITNGLLIPYKDIVHNFEWIRFSLDASTPEQFKEIKGVDGFDTVMENIEFCCKNKREDQLIGVAYLITSKSAPHLPELAKRVKDMGASFLQIRTLDDHKETGEEFADVIKEVQPLDEEDVFDVLAHQLDWEVDCVGNAGLPCRANGLSTVLGPNGDLYFCCRLHSNHLPDGSSMGVMGNIYEHSVADIWKSPRRRQYQESMLDPETCRKWCPSCRHTKHNALIEELRNTKTRNFI